MKLWTAVLVASLSLSSLEAMAAKRLGGGKSMGQQSSQVTQREAARPAPATPASSPAQVAPAQGAAQPAAAPSPATVAQQPQRKPWGAMLGGLAAGLGLAWLAHSLGFGAEFGQFLMFALVALVFFALLGMFMRRRAPLADDRSPYAFEGASASGQTQPASLPQYNPHNVGNDASARPMDTDPSYTPVATRQGAVIGSALAGHQTWGIPAEFDSVGFVKAAKDNFIVLQKAWDRSDIATLRSMMTDGMLQEIKTQLAEREANASGQPNQTDVVMLEAQLLGIEEVNGFYMASVEFSGMIREEPSAGPTPFREVWNMTKPQDGSTGWLVAGVQALE
jgi:predicted lipid-binding transport protein (Tim44 family)